jgi:hypothetical protein
MKKSKIFLATATLALAVTAIFATKANKKFVTITSAKTDESGLNFRLKGINSTLDGFMTMSITGNQLKVKVAGQDLGLYTVTDSNPIYLK